jgi:cell division protein FtsB
MDIHLSRSAAIASVVAGMAVLVGGAWSLFNLYRDVDDMAEDIADIQEGNNAIRDNIAETNAFLQENVRALNWRVDLVHKRVDDTVFYGNFVMNRSDQNQNTAQN